MDAYWGKTTEVAKERLDAELDEYWDAKDKAAAAAEDDAGADEAEADAEQEEVQE
jgi:hypothetical protein